MTYIYPRHIWRLTADITIPVSYLIDVNDRGCFDAPALLSTCKLIEMEKDKKVHVLMYCEQYALNVIVQRQR